MCFNLVCFLNKVSPAEEAGYHTDNLFELAFFYILRQPWTGDDYVIKIGGDAAPAGAKCL